MPEIEERNGIYYINGKVVGEKPLSAKDPLLSLWVEGAALGPVFELSGKGLLAGAKFVAPKTTGIISKGLNTVKTGVKSLFNKKVPFTTAKSVYNEGRLTNEEIIEAAKLGFIEAYKSYNTGGSWYERLIQNGIPKEQIEALSREYLKNLVASPISVGESGLEDAVASATAKSITRPGGKVDILPGENIVIDPRYAKSKDLVSKAVTHESGHASSMNIEPIGSDAYNTHKNYQVLVGKKNPNIVKAMEHNASIRPQLKKEVVKEIEKDPAGPLARHVKNVNTDQEIRSRAFTAEIEGLSGLNWKLLDELYEKNSLNNYMKHFMGLSIPITVGVGITSKQQGGTMNYIDYLKNGSGIHIKKKNRGKFTESAKAAGEGVQEHAHKVMNDPNATPLQKKRANFAIQAKKWHHKHEDGGALSYLDFFNYDF